MDSPFSISESVAYQTGSVVSRELIGKPSGTVTMFSFDAGQGLSEHTTPYGALAVVVDGSARITVGGTAHSVPAGQAIMLPPDVPHAVKAVERFKMLLVMIRS